MSLYVQRDPNNPDNDTNVIYVMRQPQNPPLEEVTDDYAPALAWLNGERNPTAVEQAKTLLEASDLTAIRCAKANISFPTTWQTYVTTLRGIINGSGDPIPARPDYPSGT